MPEGFKFEIVKHIATLSKHGRTTKELNLISYNGAPPKYDLRRWREGQMFKGLTLTGEELEALKDALNKEDIAG